MIPRNGSSLGRAGGRLRRYPGGTENASIFATVRGSMPNRRAASRRLTPSTYTARRTCPYSSTRFIPPPTSAAPRQMGYCCRIFSPAQPVYPAASVRDFLSGAYRSMKSNLWSQPFLRPGGWNSRLRRPASRISSKDSTSSDERA